MDPEIAHGATINALRLGLAPEQDEPDPPELKTTLAGLELNNPVGMAAGFDKNGEVPRPLVAHGLRHGRGRHRDAAAAARQRQAAAVPRRRAPRASSTAWASTTTATTRSSRGSRALHTAAVLGVNIGANKDSRGFRRRLRARRHALCAGRRLPHGQRLVAQHAGPARPAGRGSADAAARCGAQGARQGDGPRAGLPQDRARSRRGADGRHRRGDRRHRARRAHRLQHHDLARRRRRHGERRASAAASRGKPLFDLATRRLAQMRQRVGTLPIIGVGGIHSPQSAVAKFEAGADAIQLYSALVFGGLDLLDRIKRGLAAAVRARASERSAELSRRRRRPPQLGLRG